MTRQDYIELICRILRGSTEHVERPLPDPTFNMVVGYAIEADLDLEAWKMMCYRSLNGQAESIVAEVCAILQPGVIQSLEKKPTFELLTFSDLMARPDKEWLFQKFLGVRDFGMMFGLPGAGKTFITLDLILSMITGRDFAGNFQSIRPAKVLYCTDEGIGGLKSRFKTAAAYYDVIPDPSMLRVCLTMPQLFMDIETGWQHFLNDVVGNFEPDFIFLDTLFNSMVGAKENVADDASVAIHNAKAIRDALNCGIFWLHHSNKANEWPRGTSAWMGSMDLIIQLDAGLMSCFKAKDAPGFVSLGFDLLSAGEEDCSAVVKWSGVKEHSEAIGEVIFQFLRLNANKQYTAKELCEMFNVNSSSNIPRALAGHLARKVVETALRDPHKAPSKTNPMLYFCTDANADVTFAGLSLPGREE